MEAKSQKSKFLAYSVESFDRLRTLRRRTLSEVEVRIAYRKLSAIRYPLNAKTLFFLVCAFCIFNFIGCAAIKETAKGIAGISTKALEDNRKSAIVKAFNYDYLTCYTKVQDILKHIGAYVYASGIKKHMIAIYISGEDTTPVGLFFKELDAVNTQIEVSSPSVYAKETISRNVFFALHPEEENKQPDIALKPPP